MKRERKPCSASNDLNTNSAPSKHHYSPPPSPPVESPPALYIQRANPIRGVTDVMLWTMGTPVRKTVGRLSERVT